MFAIFVICIICFSLLAFVFSLYRWTGSRRGDATARQPIESSRSDSIAKTESELMFDAMRKRSSNAVKLAENGDVLRGCLEMKLAWKFEDAAMKMRAMEREREERMNAQHSMEHQ